MGKEGVGTMSVDALFIKENRVRRLEPRGATESRQPAEDGRDLRTLRRKKH